MRKNVANRSPPACVDGGNGMVFLVIEQYGDAVGGRDADATAGCACDKCVDALQHGLTFAVRCVQVSFVDDE